MPTLPATREDLRRLAGMIDHPGTLAGIGRVTSLDDVLLKAAGAGLAALLNRDFRRHRSTS
jgi:hypothetical protein